MSKTDKIKEITALGKQLTKSTIPLLEIDYRPYGYTFRYPDGCYQYKGAVVSKTKGDFDIAKRYMSDNPQIKEVTNDSMGYRLVWPDGSTWNANK